MIRLGMLLLPTVDNRWNFALQMGVRHVIAKLSPELTGGAGPYDYETLREHVRRYAAFGFQIDALEGDQFDMSTIKMGLDGRTEAVERYKRMLQNMGKLGICTLCYNFMPIGWYRNRHQVKDRGGSLVTGYRHAEEPQNTAMVLSADALWEHYEWFLKAVLPAAEDAGVRLALHPDDPPAPEIKGIGRIFISAENVERALSLSSSPMHGLTFCQATYKTMGEDVPALARNFGARGKIFFIHIRDVKGTWPDFVETFPETGDTDMAEMFRVYREIGFDGLMRPDHAPALAGAPPPVAFTGGTSMGYEAEGMIYTMGYIKGLMQASGMRWQ